MELMEALRPVVADGEQTLRRFMGNRALYQKFVHKFPQDENMSLLEEAVAAGDWAGAERFAHTLKGVAANLGFSELAQAASDVVAALRRGEEGAALSPLLEGVRDRHRDILSAIARCDP